MMTPQPIKLKKLEKNDWKVLSYSSKKHHELMQVMAECTQQKHHYLDYGILQELRKMLVRKLMSENPRTLSLDLHQAIVMQDALWEFERGCGDYEAAVARRLRNEINQKLPTIKEYIPEETE